MLSKTKEFNIGCALDVIRRTKFIQERLDKPSEENDVSSTIKLVMVSQIAKNLGLNPFEDDIWEIIDLYLADKPFVYSGSDISKPLEGGDFLRFLEENKLH